MPSVSSINRIVRNRAAEKAKTFGGGHPMFNLFPGAPGGPGGLPVGLQGGLPMGLPFPPFQGGMPFEVGNFQDRQMLPPGFIDSVGTLE